MVTSDQWSGEPAALELQEVVGFDVLERLAQVAAEHRVIVSIQVTPFTEEPEEST